jgi:hypothetical protein
MRFVEMEMESMGNLLHWAVVFLVVSLVIGLVRRA